MEFHDIWQVISVDPTKTLAVFLGVLWTTITLLLLLLPWARHGR